MKKVLIVLLFAITLTMTACGSSKPKYMNQETYDLGCRALEIFEKYNKAEISADDAKSRLKDISAKLDDLRLLDDMERIENDTLASTIGVYALILDSKPGAGITAEESLRNQLEK